MDNLKARITAAVAAIYAATTIEALYEHYKAEVGYSPADDGDKRDMETLRGDLIDYQREACYDAGISCAGVGIRTDADGEPYLPDLTEPFFKAADHLGQHGYFRTEGAAQAHKDAQGGYVAETTPGRVWRHTIPATAGA